MQRIYTSLACIYYVLFFFTSNSAGYTTHNGGYASGTWYGTHYITATIVIDAADTLVLAPGAVVKFAPGVELWGYGTLIISGTAADSVFITGRDDNGYGETITGSDGACSPGDWRGIWQTGKMQISYGVLLYGGGSGGYSGSNLFFSGNSSLSNAVTHSRFSFSQSEGLIFSTAVCTIDSSQFSYNTARGMYAYANNLNHIIARYNSFIHNGGAAAQIDNAGDLLGNTGSGNANNCILTSGSISYNTLWSTVNGLPVVLYGNLNVETGFTLTIAPGSVLKCGSDVWFTIYGSLLAAGTENDSIIITSYKDDTYGGDANGDGTATLPGRGNWKVLNVFGNATFRYCRIRYGGNIYGNVQLGGTGNMQFSRNVSEYSGTDGLITANTTMVIDSNTFAYNTGNGLQCWYNVTGTNHVRRNSFSNNGTAAQLSSFAHGSIYGNTGSGNTTNAILIGGDASGNTNWSTSNDLPIKLTGWFYIAAGCTLTIDSGVIITNTQVFYGPGTFRMAGGRLETEMTTGLNGLIWCTGYSFSGGTSYRFNGSSAQVTGTYLPDTVSTLWIDNPAGVTLSKDVVVSSLLLLDTGKIATDERTLTVGTSTSQRGDVIRMGGYIAGSLKRQIGAVAGSYDFPIGSSSTFCPILITFTTAPVSGGTLTLRFLGTDPGSNGVNLSENPIRDGKYSITRYCTNGYWTTEAGNGLTGGTYSVEATGTGFTGFSSLSDLHVVQRNGSGANWLVTGSHQTAGGTLSAPILRRNNLVGFSEFGAGIGSAIQSSNISITSQTSTSLSITLTAGNGEKRAIFIKQGSTGYALPDDDTTYSASAVYGYGSQIGTSGWYCVYNGTGNQVLVTGLTPSTGFRVFATEYNGTTGNQKYNSDTAAGNPAYGSTLPAPSSVHVTAFIEGLFDGMVQVPDTVRVCLRSVNNLSTDYDAALVIFGATGQGAGYFSSVLSPDSSYYLVIVHRSALETWSAGPLLPAGNTMTYDFSSAASQAYGNNQVLKSGKYCLYSGDINRDGLVDLNDMILVDNDNAAFVAGYTATDINGDALVDLNDLIIIDNNNASFIGKITPEAAAHILPASKKNRIISK